MSSDVFFEARLERSRKLYAKDGSLGRVRRPVLRLVHRSFSEVGSFMRRMEAHQSEEGRRRMADAAG